MTELPHDCVDPSAIVPDDHLAYARGEAGPAVAQHMDACPACSREAAAYAGVECISFDGAQLRTDIAAGIG